MCENDANLSEVNLNIKSKASLQSAIANDLVTSPNSVCNFSSPIDCSHENHNSVNAAVLAEYHLRLQLYDYAAQAAARFRLAHSNLTNSINARTNAAVAAAAAYNIANVAGYPVSSYANSVSPFSPFQRYDPRFRFISEEPKPQHSYIGLIAMAILSSAEKKMVLSDIYQHILDNYPYFRNRGPGWRNSIRHNLSLNDCFIKAGRSANGKGHYWAIHPANMEDFKKGDFRRRKAQRKVRKHMGLSVPEDEDSPSPSPTPNTITANSDGSSFNTAHFRLASGQGLHNSSLLNESLIQQRILANANQALENHRKMQSSLANHALTYPIFSAKSVKRQFDVESLLTPDCKVV